MSTTGSISLSGLLGGTAGQIDTTSLISNLMQAAAVPQQQLQDQLTTLQTRQNAYQALNSKVTTMLTAAQALTDATAWSASAASSSSSAVAASSDGTAVSGSFTFDVTSLAQAQVTTVALGTDGNVVTDPSQGLNLRDHAGVLHPIPLAGGSPDAVATAINNANLGVRANVVTTDQGRIVQLVSQKTGTANDFSIEGFETTPQTVVAAADAQITVGTPTGPNPTGYTVTSSSNTFANLWPGVTVTAGALASNVTVNVTTDESSISNKLQALVSAANAATSTVAAATAKGATLAGQYQVYGIRTGIADAVAQGTGTGNGSLKSYGIDMDKDGTISLDADAFAKAYAADPTGTKAAISGAFASRLADVGTTATAAATGTLTQAMAESTTDSQTLTKQIDNWTTRLTKIQSDLQAKYAAMETALAKLQSTQTYLTSMLKSASGSDSSSS